MKIIIVLGHPKFGSFNHAIADTVFRELSELGHEVTFRDLYAERFDPVLPDGEAELPLEKTPGCVRESVRQLQEANGLVFVHPNWWGGPPCILRGWLDRVFRRDVAYHCTGKELAPLLTDKTIQVFTTSNTPREVELNVYHDPLENFWKTIVFGFCGCQSFERCNFEQIILSTPDERANWLQQVVETVRRRFPQEP